MDITVIRQLHQSGKLDQAKAGYLAILEDHLPALSPECIAILNTIGTICYAQGQLDQAILYYRQAIHHKKDYVDAYYNLGLALTKKELLVEASDTYRQLLHHDPTHMAARFHLGCHWMRQENMESAINEFLLIESTHPYHVETQVNLATCYLKRGRFLDATRHYKEALELNSSDTQILFNLGYLMMQHGSLDTAIQYYQRALLVDPDCYEAHRNLGVAFLMKPRRDLALPHFKEAVRLKPNDTSLRYTISALEQETPLLSAPPEYIQSLFDAYADHYEPHLLQALDYQVPDKMHALFSKWSRLKKSIDILDVGCGTGLSGAPFKSYARQLVGVDLSANMLEVARQKNMYDELIQADALIFLNDKIALYDLMIAGDVLVYHGDLENVFRLAHQALRSGGELIFNVEEEYASHSYKMNQSGRFSHHASYIEQLAKAHHFTIRSAIALSTRSQHGAGVPGMLYFLKKDIV